MHNYFAEFRAPRGSLRRLKLGPLLAGCKDMKHRPSLVASLTLLLAILDRGAWAAVYKNDALWPKKTIRICFYHSEIPTPPNTYKTLKPDDSLKEFSKNVITREFSIARTGLEFTSWNDCDAETEKADSFLEFTADTFSTGFTEQYGVEKNGPHVSIGLGKYSKKPTETELRRLDATLVHEFGHLAGLTHEHQYFRSKALKDPVCKEDERTYKWIKSLKRFARGWGHSGAGGFSGRIRPYYTAFKKGKKSYGSYDSGSMMNYCHLRLLERNDASGALSEQDIETLRFLYP